MAFPFPLTSLMLMLEMTKNNYPHLFKSGLTDDFSVRPLDFYMSLFCVNQRSHIVKTCLLFCKENGSIYRTYGKNLL